MGEFETAVVVDQPAAEVDAVPSTAPVESGRLAYTLDVHDIVAVNRLFIDHSRIHRRQLRVVRILLLVAALAFALYGGLVGSTVSRAMSLGFAVVLIIMLNRTALRAGTARLIRRQLRNASARGLVGRHEIQLSADGFTDVSEVKRSQHEWAGIGPVYDTGECLFVYVNAFSAVAVPRARVKEGDYDAFVSTLGQFTTVSAVKAGESFEHARAAGTHYSPKRRQPRVAGAVATGIAITMLWSGVAGNLIADYFIPGNLPEPLWWTLYNFFIVLPGLIVASLLAARRGDQDTRETVCRRCGYQLRGLSRPQCPECGEVI